MTAAPDPNARTPPRKPRREMVRSTTLSKSLVSGRGKLISSAIVRGQVNGIDVFHDKAL